jgi:hypothetical protein
LIYFYSSFSLSLCTKLTIFSRGVEVKHRSLSTPQLDPSLTLSRERIHYDARYSNGPLEEYEQREAIKVLIQTYLSTFRDLGVQTWLMHGSLLGWWWGKKVSLDAPVIQCLTLTHA